MGESAKYKVERQIYSHQGLLKEFPEEDTDASILDKLNCQKKIHKIEYKSMVRYLFPFPFALASFYSYKYILDDVVAGLTMFIFHIPQGMAFSLLGELQPINGLYASFFPPLIYSLFGTSRHISIGTFSITALLSSIPVMREANFSASNVQNHTFNESLIPNTNNEFAKLQVAISTTLLTGIILIVMGIFQMGCIMNYVNDALIGGFICASSFHIGFTQVPSVLGYSIQKYSGLGELPFKLYLFAIGIKKLHWITLGMAAVSMTILFIFTKFVNPLIKKKFNLPVPIQFILVIFGTWITYHFSFEKKYSVQIVGPIPKGLPKPMVPDVRYWPKIFIDAIILAIMTFIINSALVKMHCLEFSYDANYNQELAAYGLSNVFGSFFQCLVSSGSLSRSRMVTDCGMKSQIATLISCVLMLFMILFLAPLFQHLPKVVLSSIIIISLGGSMSQVTKFPYLYKFSKFDFNIWIVSFSATILLNVPVGLIVGFIYSLLTVFMRFHNPKALLLGQLPGTNIYRNIKTYRDAIEVTGIKIFRYDTPIYFANAERFQEKLFKKCGADPRNLADALQSLNANVYKKPIEITPLLSLEELVVKYHTNEKVKFIIIDLSSVNYIDNVAVRVFENIYAMYREIGVFIFLAEANNRVIKLLSKSNFAKENFEEIIFVSIHDAVLKAMSIMFNFEKK